MDASESYYDQDSTIFSPDGRLFQVEYARKTVKKGATTIALKFKNGILFIAYKKNFSNIIEKSSTEKINKINDYLGCTYVGLSADANHLTDYALERTTLHKLWYDEEIKIKNLVEDLCEYKHIFTTYNGLRPFGVIFILGGVDKTGVRLFATDPSGAFLEYKAISEGKSNNKINEFLEKNYDEKLDINKALNLGITAMKKTTKKIDSNELEIVVIEKDKKFYKLQDKEIKKLLRKVL